MASPDDLRFQDFGSAAKETKVNLNDDAMDEGITHDFKKFPDSARSDEEELLGDVQQSRSQASFWTFKFYQQFFDVETEQVKSRIMYSMMPKIGQSYLDYHVRPRPDLYGPFWVCVTLVFSIAISGNISNYLQTAGAGGKYIWKYDFHKVSYAATAVFFYVWILPIFLYLAFAWKKSSQQITFLEILCVYGYSLCIYVPISVLWVIQVTWLQWLLVLLGSAVSGVVLVQSLWPSLKPAPSEDGAKSWSSWALLGVVAFLHVLLAVGFMMYFFHVPASAVAVAAAEPVATPAVPVKLPEVANVTGEPADAATARLPSKERRNAKQEDLKGIAVEVESTLGNKATVASVDDEKNYSGKSRKKRIILTHSI